MTGGQNGYANTSGSDRAAGRHWETLAQVRAMAPEPLALRINRRDAWSRPRGS